jgi:hypothetical protein
MADSRVARTRLDEHSAHALRQVMDTLDLTESAALRAGVVELARRLTRRSELRIAARAIADDPRERAIALETLEFMDDDSTWPA